MDSRLIILMVMLYQCQSTSMHSIHFRENKISEYMVNTYVPVLIFVFFRDKILLIINLPSKCELMEPYFKELNALHEKYSDQGLVILAFPCNEFLKQVKYFTIIIVTWHVVV